eukprot:gene1714-2890_t
MGQDARRCQKVYLPHTLGATALELVEALRCFNRTAYGSRLRRSPGPHPQDGPMVDGIRPPPRGTSSVPAVGQLDGCGSGAQGVSSSRDGGDPPTVPLHGCDTPTSPSVYLCPPADLNSKFGLPVDIT